MLMRINSIRYNNSVVDGPGIRTVLFMQGCDLHCKGCQNRSTWDLNKGKEVSVYDLVNELKLKVFPYGKIGNYLYSQLENIYKTEYNPFFLLRSGENWTLGDNSLIFALIINQYRDFITYRKAPKINDNGLYEGSSSKKMIKVFTDIDVRFTLEDFFSKLALVYKD